MPAVARLTDICTGHGGYPSRENTSASADVIINGLGAHRQSDTWATHCRKSCHDSFLESGSDRVIVNGLQLGRIGDPVACGSLVARGSSDVFAG